MLQLHERLRARPLIVWAGWALSFVCMWGARALDFESTMSEAVRRKCLRRKYRRARYGMAVVVFRLTRVPVLF